MLSLHAAVFSCLHKTWLVSFEKKSKKIINKLAIQLSSHRPKKKQVNSSLYYSSFKTESFVSNFYQYTINYSDIFNDIYSIKHINDICY